MFIYKKNKALWKLCVENNIPIIRKKTAKTINSIINKNKYQSLLEIGTAYGFSCSLWVQNNNLKQIVSVEKNVDNYAIASQHLQNNTHLQLINSDAFELEIDSKFDLIFIDGPKSHQEVLFEKYFKLLSDQGTIVVDNLHLKKFKDLDPELLTKNQKKLLEKVSDFKKYLESHKDINYKFLDIDDGIAIITKRL